MENELPITLTFWLVALLPLVTLLILLVGFRWTAAQAGAVGFFIAVLVAWLVFRSGFDVIAIATAKGVWDAIFILYVIWPALLLYEVTEKAGAFDVFRVGIERFTKSRLLLVLAFGWVFASFLQGIAGFGTPIAIVAPLLVGIGVRPVMAVVIPLIGHSWANMFGTLAVGWLATIQVVDLQSEPYTAFIAALLLWIPNLLGGLGIAWLFGGIRSVVRALPAILIISLVHGGGQIFLVGYNPIISNFIPATLALGVIFAIERIPLYREAESEKGRIFQDEKAAEEQEKNEEPKMPLNMAFLPYYVLIAVSLIGLLVTPINEFLGQVEIGFAFPGAETGFGETKTPQDEYGKFDIFTHPGSFLLVSAFIGYLVFRSRRYYENIAGRELLSDMAKNALPASIAVLGFLTLSKIMDHSGMTTVLALGIAAVSPPIVYAFLSNFIGILGAFMTSSNTASNILFAPLQQETALATALSEGQIIGAQSAGGAIGNAIAPANVVLGTGPAKISGQEGAVLKYTLPWALIVAVLTGALSVLLFTYFA